MGVNSIYGGDPNGGGSEVSNFPSFTPDYGPNRGSLGILCGDYPSTPTGNGRTAQIQNLGANYVLLGSNLPPIQVRFGIACIEVANSNAVRTSQILVDAFNWAANEVLMELNGGTIAPTATALKIALKEAYIGYLNIYAFGSSFSEGQCLGNIPPTIAKYHNQVTGNCE